MSSDIVDVLGFPDVQKQSDNYSFALKESGISGVGVFALCDISAGAKLDLFAEDEEIAEIPFTDIKNEKEQHRLDWFCLRDEEDQMYYCPANFNRMSLGWYLNHSNTPNTINRDDVMFALRDIQKGEELTVDYNELEPWRKKDSSSMYS